MKLAPIKGKGMGVIARKPIPMNTRVPVSGQYLNHQQHQDLLNELRDQGEGAAAVRSDYLFETAGGVIDGYAASGFAAKMNEPSLDFTASCALLNRHVPGAPGVRPCIVTARDIAAGEELMCCYRKTRERGYKKGVDVTEAVKNKLV